MDVREVGAGGDRVLDWVHRWHQRLLIVVRLRTHVLVQGLVGHRLREHHLHALLMVPHPLINRQVSLLVGNDRELAQLLEVLPSAVSLGAALGHARLASENICQVALGLQSYVRLDGAVHATGTV